MGAASTEKAYHRDFKYVNLPGISASYKHENYIDARQNVCAYLPTIQNALDFSMSLWP